MPSLKYVGLFLIIIIFGMLFIPKIIDRVNSDSIVDSSRSQSAEPLNFIVLNGEAKKVLPFMFTNQDSLLISNEDFLGKVYVAEFFFTSCPSICPIMNQKMVTIQDAFFGNPNFGIASISITPEIDTPEILKEYAQVNRITHRNWHLLTGKSDDMVYALAKQGFQLYAGKGEDEHGGFEHSGYFALVDKNGFIRSRKDENGNTIIYYNALEDNGFPDQIKEIKEDIKILLNE